MSDLKAEHPDIEQRFDDWFHAIRRSDRQWTGLSSDLIIEQVMMRSLKSSGGLTRGRGMTEDQRLVWLLSMTACVEINQAMQELSEVNYNTGEQNKDMIEQDKPVTGRTHMPFSIIYRTETHSRMTRVHVHPTVNVDTAHAVGATILNSIDGRTPDEHTFGRKDQVVTLGTTNSDRIDGDDVQVDPLLLFQRLITVAQTSDELESAFKHELCSYPPALFD